MKNKGMDSDYRDLRDRANYLRYSFVEEIDKHLLALESSLLDHGFNVRWVQNEEGLFNSISDLLPQKQYNRVCFDLPKIPEAFKNSGNLVQMYPIESVAAKEAEIDTLIVNADFAVASDGSLVFMNCPSRDLFNFVNNLIVVVNIEDIVISRDDISLFLKLKNRVGDFPSDVKIVSKSFDKIEAEAFQSSDSLGYKRNKVTVSVLLYENNILELLSDVSLRDSLYCIKCGRCLEVCPVAKASHQTSPIDIVRNNCINHFSKNGELFSQTTLCGNCQEVCPVNIPIMDMLIYEMNISNGMNNYSRNKQLNSLFSKRSKLNKFNNPILKFLFVKRFFGKSKMLYNYFKSQQNTFFNIAHNSPELSDE